MMAKVFVEEELMNFYGNLIVFVQNTDITSTTDPNLNPGMKKQYIV